MRKQKDGGVIYSTKGSYLDFAYAQSRLRKLFANSNSQHFCLSYKKLHLLLFSVNNKGLNVANK